MPGPPYSSDFSATPVQTSDVSYAQLNLTAAVTQLYWPATSGVLPPLAKLSDVVASASGQIITLPPANSGSLGSDAVMTNRGLFQIQIEDFEGNAVGFIAAGVSLYLYIDDNSSQAGGWSTLTFGAGSSIAQAAALAGDGLIAGNGNTLNWSIITRNLVHDYEPQNTDRARLINWTSGVGNLNLDPVSTYPSGFVMMTANNGSGTFSINTTSPELIDGLTTVALQPGESCFIVASTADASWHTVGRGRSRLFGYTLLTKNVAAGGTFILTPQEASATVQIYTGALATNATVQLPPVVQVYYISNQTTTNFTTTFTTGSGTSVSTSGGDSLVLISDGTNIISASKGSSGGGGGGGGGGGSYFGISIYQFGCKGNGSFDDTTNLNAALAFAATIAVAAIPVDLEFDGGQCAISAQLDLPTGVGIRNGGLKALSGGTLSATVPMVILDGGNFKRITSMVFDCNRVSAGVVCSGSDNPVISRLQIRNFLGYGFGTLSNCTDVQMDRVLVEEWTVGSAGETDYTQRVAIGFNMQGLNFSAIGCTARYCLTPVAVNAGGGWGVFQSLYTTNGSSGTVKPNLNAIKVLAQTGQVQFNNCIIEDGVVEIDDAFNGTIFNNCMHRSTSNSTVVDAFHLSTAVVGATGAGLVISGARYQATFTNFIVQQVTGSGTWAAALAWYIFNNVAAGGGTANSALQRAPMPFGGLSAPGMAFENTTAGFYRDGTFRFGFTEGGKFYAGLKGSTWTVGDGSITPNVRVDGGANNTRGFELATANKLRWGLYENSTAEGGSNAGSDFNIINFDDTGAAIGTPLAITRSTLRTTVFSLKTTPTATDPPTDLNNGELCFVRLSNTSVKIYLRGSDGTYRQMTAIGAGGFTLA